MPNPPHSAGEWLHVVAAVIRRGPELLIAKRPDHLHQGGLWEFPGGKVEAGEAPERALRRELAEELGIEVESALPLIRVPHAYPDRRVVLDVWEVLSFTGEPHGREGQEVRWVSADSLRDYPFPAANLPIITAALLPSLYLITPEPGERSRWPAFIDRLAERITAGIQLIQLRAKGLSEVEYKDLAGEVVALAHSKGAKVVLNASPDMALALGADGVHLTEARLMGHHKRPLPRELLVGASCHTPRALNHAVTVGVDFAVLSPIKTTASHPEAQPLGWESAARWIGPIPMPVYALGGVGPVEVVEARRHGAQGIAAITALWSVPSEELANALGGRV